MRTYTRYMCDGELCHPKALPQDGPIPIDTEIFFCDVDDGTGELPEGWMAIVDNRRQRTLILCPRCYKNQLGRLINEST